MKRLLTFGIAGALTIAAFVPTASALELQPALEQLKSYKSGAEQDSIAALEAAVNASLENPAARSQLAKQLADFLSKPADDGGKILVSLYAALVADDALVPVAQDMLKKPALCRSGASILRAVNTPKSEAALIAGLAAPAARIDVLNSFSRQPGEAAVRAIGALIGGNVPPDVFAAGASALARANSPAAVGILVAIAETAKDDRRLVAADRAIILLENFTGGASAIAKPAMAMLARLAKLAKLPPQLSRAIFVAQYRFDPAGQASRLASFLGSESSEDFVTAIAALREAKDPASIQTAVAALAKAPAAHLPALVSALAARGAKDSYAGILEMAAKNPALAVPAINAFPQLGDASQASQILAFADKEPAAVCDALGELPSASIDEILIAQLKGATPATQTVLVEALARRRVVAAFNVLVPMADSTDLKLRRQTLLALDVLSQPKDVPVLLATYQKAQTAAARVPLSRALRRLLADPANSSYAPAVRAALTGEKNPAAKNGLLALVAASGSAEDLKLLLASVPEEGLPRREWFKAAAFWSGGADGWDAIKARIAEEKEPGARQLGIQGLADLVTAKDEIPAAQSGAYLRDLVKLAGDNDSALRYLLSKIGKVPDADLVATVKEIAKRPTLSEEATKAGKQLDGSISKAKQAAQARG